MAALDSMVAKDEKLLSILSAPTLTVEDKQAIVDELTKQAGSSGSSIKNFLDTLAENNRLGLLQGVCEKFNQLMSAARGEVAMTVTSAQVKPCPAHSPTTLARILLCSHGGGDGRRGRVHVISFPSSLPRSA